MRSMAWATGLLACAIRGGTAQKAGGGGGPVDTAPIIVQFHNLTGVQPNTRVLVSGSPYQELTWTLGSDYDVDKVELWNGDASIGEWLSSVRSRSNEVKRMGQGKDTTEGGIETLTQSAGPAQPSLINLNVTQIDRDGKLSFDTQLGPIGTSTGATFIWAANLNTALYVKLSWSGNGTSGFLNDKAFAVAKGSDIAAAQSAVEEAEARQFPPDTAIPVATATNSAIVASTGMPSATSAPASPSSTNAIASTSSSSSLSTGAIVGIVVGAVAALAIVGALVWFFCFRRRKQHTQAHAADYSHDAGTHAMMADKEVPGISESSPHSAYGDDGGRLHDRSSTAMDSAYAPYRDHTPGPAVHTSPATTHAMTSSQTHLPHHGTSSPTPPASTQYAHLVEEGMTADEIRRLEEEERALDQAIEAAGTNRPAH